MSPRRAPVLLLGAVLACGTDEPEKVVYTGPEDVAWEGTAPYLTELPAPRLLRRISLDLRGIFPSVEELDAVEADPSRVAEFRDAYLEDPRLQDRLVSLLAERWNTVMDQYEVGSSDYGLPYDQIDRFNHSVGEEPLRIMAHVINEDRPWTEIVTADYTMANETLADVWPIDRPDGDGWQVSHYTDGRPPGGVVSTNGLWWRYVTNSSNKNRGRIAAISNLLLCTDILARPVVFQRSNGDDAEEAVKSNPACLSCHSALDPAAANLFGYWWIIQYNPYEMDTYHPEREPLGPSLLGTEPGWYGIRTGGLVDLGTVIAEDPRFVRCGAESMAEQLWRRDADLGDWATIEALRQQFVANDLRPKGLLRAVTDTPEYRAGGFVPGAPEDVVAKTRVERLLTPNQLSTTLAAETGFSWSASGFDQLENDLVGYRTLRGGVNGYSATHVQQEPGLTWVLVNTRAAEIAASTVVRRDVLDGLGDTIHGVTLETRPTDPAFADALRALHWRWYAERADDAWLASITALWTELAADNRAEAAWRGVIDVMIRDPRFQVY